MAEVGRYASERDAGDHGLVILAMRLGYWVEPVSDGFSLRVAMSVADDVRTQLALFDRESIGWPPRLRALARLHFHWPLPLGWAVATVVMFRMQLRWPGRFETFGALRGDAIFTDGEWWRPATALFLHGDMSHLLGNIAAGFFMFGLVLGDFGIRRGSLALLGSALAGNLAAAALHPWSGYTSIGASTAVFGALGVLTGAAVRAALWNAPRLSWRTLMLPLLAGGSLLALYGAGGLRTDVVAHATGFVAGLASGLAVRRRGRAGDPRRAGRSTG